MNIHAYLTSVLYSALEEMRSLGLPSLQWRLCSHLLPSRKPRGSWGVRLRVQTSAWWKLHRMSRDAVLLRYLGPVCTAGWCCGCSHAPVPPCCHTLSSPRPGWCIGNATGRRRHRRHRGACDLIEDRGVNFTGSERCARAESVQSGPVHPTANRLFITQSARSRITHLRHTQKNLALRWEMLQRSATSDVTLGSWVVDLKTFRTRCRLSGSRAHRHTQRSPRALSVGVRTYSCRWELGSVQSRDVSVRLTWVGV